MKTFKKSIRFIILSLSAICLGQMATAQKSLSSKEIVIKNAVENQAYTFYAQNVTPSSGRQRFLTSEYTLNISKDTIESYLPFFGRAYSAPMDPSDAGIKFASTSFDYNLAPRKKGGWNVDIKPKDAQGVQQLTLSVFENGNATLQVISTNRQPISFNGYVAAKKERK
ncbi:MAG: hypothetical protein JWP81_3369 [Ferruginibacter sp.]|nr:hypothetical protein [Ferruginibacter sp.]